MLSVFEYSYFLPGLKLTGSFRTQLITFVGETKPRGSVWACLMKPSDFGVIRETAGVVQQLGQGHRAPRLRHRRQHFADRAVESELARLDEVERDGAAERLGDGGDPHVVGGARLRRLVDVGHAGAERGQLAVPVQRRDRSRRTAGRFGQLFEPRLDFGVGRLCRGDAGTDGKAEAEEDEGSGERTKDAHPLTLSAGQLSNPSPRRSSRPSQTPRRPSRASAAARRLRVSWITALRSGSGGNGRGLRRT